MSLGDAPGLNAVIQAATIAADKIGWEVFGIREGYSGILDPGNYPEGGLLHLTPRLIRDISHLGGTILGTVNKGNPFKVSESMPGGMVVDKDRSGEVLEAFRRHQLDALIAIGGDGSLTIANALHKKGVRVVGVPKTIDNDLSATLLTFGHQTAVSFATECIDRLHSTAAAHRRVMVIEVMGRYAGFIALNAGVAGRADAILIPEIPYDIEKVTAHVHLRQQSHGYSICGGCRGCETAQRIAVGQRARGWKTRAVGRHCRNSIRATAGADRNGIACSGSWPPVARRFTDRAGSHPRLNVRRGGCEGASIGRRRSYGWL